MALELNLQAGLAAGEETVGAGCCVPACLFCDESRALTKEHVFPASLGGTTEVKVSCKACNETFGREFEDYFASAFLPLRYVLKIPNRKKKVPSVIAKAQIEGFDVNVRMDGKSRDYSVVDDFVIKETSATSWDILALTKRGLELGKAEAARRGAKRFRESPLPKDIQIQPISEGVWNFLSSPQAFRTAAKVAILGLAAQNKPLPRSESFSSLKRFVRFGEGAPVSLVFNPDFAERIKAGPHQHLIMYSFDYHARTVSAVVIFFGGLFYLVNMSSDARFLDYGFTHAEDTHLRRTTPAFVTRLENERESVSHLLTSSGTISNSMLESATYFIKLLQSSHLTS
jgi:hypothetical protein